MSTQAQPSSPPRRSNWPAALALFVEEKRCEKFVWGVNDCCGFAADWVAICTGVDPCAAWRGKYRDAAGAARLIRRGGGLEALVDRALAAHGWAQIARPMARRGDVVSIATGRSARGVAAGVCIGADAVFPGPDCVSFRAMDECRLAWRIS
jgi:hypothetical protein